MAAIARIKTPILDIAYEDSGPADAPVVILLHGFPYDPRGYDDVVAILAAKGLRTIVPYLRGYGPTRFLSADTMRAGEQASIGEDLLDFMDALKIPRAILAGFDWGGRAACIVSALWPERVRGLLSCTGYAIQDVPQGTVPASPEQEARLWYQYYFHTERGRNGLTKNRRELCKLLWQMWSPTVPFDQAAYDRTAPSFDNPDFVEVVLHSYRHRTNSVAGDPRYAALEAKLAAQPIIPVPAITLQGGADNVSPASASEKHGRYFSGPNERRVLDGIGHNPPQEAPKDFAQAVMDLCALAPA